MLTIFLEWAKACPLIEKVGLEVFVNNDSAIHLYQKLGFVEEAYRPREIRLGPGRYVDTLLMYQFVR